MNLGRLDGRNNQAEREGGTVETGESVEAKPFMNRQARPATSQPPSPSILDSYRYQQLLFS